MPASGDSRQSPTISRYICATRSGNVTGIRLLLRESSCIGWQRRCVSITTLCRVSGIADGGPPSAGRTTRTGRPRSNNRPEAASRSRNASAVSGRLPLWTMSSGFPLSARSTMSAAVASDTPNSTTGTNAVACGALRFRSWVSRTGRGFRNHSRRDISGQKSRHDHLASAASSPVCQTVPLAFACTCDHLYQTLQQVLIGDDNAPTPGLLTRHDRH